MSDSETISYTLTLEDMEARIRYFLSNSSEIRRQVRRMWTIFLLLIGLLSLFIWSSEGTLSDVAEFFLAALVVFVMIWTFTRKRTALNQTMQYFGDGTNPSFFGAKEATVDETGIVIRGRVGSSQQTWRAFESIEATSSHVFLELGCTTAHIIPLNRVSGGDVDRFVELVQRYYSAR
jgi:hypothetical protein